MEILKISGITLKGKNKIREAGTDEWVVIDEAFKVQFSEEAGPWLHIQPADGKEEKSRWIHRTNDQHFDIII